MTEPVADSRPNPRERHEQFVRENEEWSRRIRASIARIDDWLERDEREERQAETRR
jgi:hypothetical protein